MSHYPPYESANIIDKATLEALKTLNINLLFRHLDDDAGLQQISNLQTKMCSRGGVGTAMLFAGANGADYVQILHYANSGDVPGADVHRVVGYSAVLFLNQSGSN